MDPLVFIDTNIFLDFYRVRNSEIQVKMLKHIEDSKEKIIMTSQIEMEFKKHRQSEIIHSLSGLKLDKKMDIPIIIEGSMHAKSLRTHLEQAITQNEKVKRKVEKILFNPSNNDSVYKCLQRLFKSESEIHLSRRKAVRFTIRCLAIKRFMLGYPPRKRNDTSVGDALNWEWMVHCCKLKNKDLIIVSRDSDYGIEHSKQLYINDWLLQEFKERVNRKKNVLLTNRLTRAMDALCVPVDEAEKEEEQYLIDTSASSASPSLSTGSIPRRISATGMVESYTPQVYVYPSLSDQDDKE